MSITQFTVEQLREFESKVIEHFEAGKIRGPVHLSYGNEEALIKIFEKVKEEDWVFSTWRNHYHALLKGIPQEWIMSEILESRSINLTNRDYRFHTSAIVGGILPMSTGVAYSLKYQQLSGHVWCFVGEMAQSTGTFMDSWKYSVNNDLPITFVVEYNGFSTNTPSSESWGEAVPELITNTQPNEIVYDDRVPKLIWYRYERKYPHVGIGKFIHF